MAANRTFLLGPERTQEGPVPPSGNLPLSDPQGCLTGRWHEAFRGFMGSEHSDPVEDLQSLSRLCHLWLRPDLHTTEQILDKLVLEQFMISMPPQLQVLVKERNVQSCKDLEDLLRRREKPKKWTIVRIQGQEFLQENSEVQVAEAEVRDADLMMDSSIKSQFIMSEVDLHPKNGQEVIGGPGNLTRMEDVSREQTVVSVQAQEFLLQNVHVQMAKAELSDANLPMDLSMRSQSFMSEVDVHPENSQVVSREPDNLTGIRDVFRGQGQGALRPETIPERGDLEGVRPVLILEKGQMEGQEETIVFESPEPHLLWGPREYRTWNFRGPYDQATETSSSVWDRWPTMPSLLHHRPSRASYCMPSEASVGREVLENLADKNGTENADTAGLPSHSSETESCTQGRKRRGAQRARGPPSRKQDNISVPQEAARQLKSNSVHAPGTVAPAGSPVQKKATRQTRYECADCKKRFDYPSQLARHQRTHRGERPFKCLACPKRFLYPSDLQVHQRIHRGEKPYCCEVCEKTFTHSSTLKCHTRLHTKEKPYVCEVCHRCFSHRGNLNVHMRTHSGLRPYGCPECDKSFTQLGTLRCHQKTHSKLSSSGVLFSSAQEGN